MPPKSSSTPPATDKTPPKDHKKMNAITIFSFVVLIIIVVTFIGAPVVSKAAGAPSLTFGTYDGIDIQYQEGNYFAKRVEELNQQYERFGGNNVDMLRQLVWRQAFESAATQIGLEREAKLAGVIVTESEIDKALFTHPTYAPAGQFSEEIYKGTNPSDKLRIRNETRTQLMIQKYIFDLAAGAKISQADLDNLAGMKFPQRKFSFVSFDEKDFPDAQVADYAKKSAQLFKTINLSKLTVTTSEADAKKIQAEAVKGDKPFEDLVKTYSKDQTDASAGLSVQAYHELKPNFTNPQDLDAIFALKKGEISPAVKTTGGWTIYKVLEAATEPDFNNPTTLNTVRAYIGRNDKGLVQDYLELQAKTLKANIKDGKLAEAAKLINKTVEATDFVSLNFNSVEFLPKLSDATKNPTFSGLSANEDFFNKAWKLKVGEVSDPILASPSVLLIKLDETKDGTATVTKEDKDKIVNTFVQERLSEIQRRVLESPKFKDNFNDVFAKTFKTAQK